MGPVEGSGVAVGHPHEALATQHSLDGAVACSGSLPLQGAVGGYWQPAQHHLSQSAHTKTANHGAAIVATIGITNEDFASRSNCQPDKLSTCRHSDSKQLAH